MRRPSTEMHTELDAMQAQPTENQTNTTHSIELDAEQAQPKQAKKGTNTAAGQGSEEKSPRRKAARKETPAPTNGRAKTTQRRGAKGSSAQKNGTIRGQSSHEAQAERPKVAQKLRAKKSRRDGKRRARRRLPLRTAGLRPRNGVAQRVRPPRRTGPSEARVATKRKQNARRWRKSCERPCVRKRR